MQTPEDWRFLSFFAYYLDGKVEVFSEMQK